MRRWRGVLGIDRKDFPQVIDRGQAIHDGLHDNPLLFVTPNPPLSVLLVKIQNLRQSQAKVGTHVSGAKQARDVDAVSLVTSLETSRAYVQELADSSTPEQAANLLKAAGFLLGNMPTYSKPLLNATQAQPGSLVHLEVNVSALTADTKGKVFFNWASSPDGGKTWNAAPSTPHGRTDIPDLTPMVTYEFRVSVTDKSGTREWSQVVALLVR